MRSIIDEMYLREKICVKRILYCNICLTENEVAMLEKPFTNKLKISKRWILNGKIPYSLIFVHANIA
jgi:hypothetical protein